MSEKIMSFAADIAIYVMAAAFGVIGFFLRRIVNHLDSKASKKDITELENALADKASDRELQSIKDSVSAIEKELHTVKEDYITKEDFFREQAKTDKKLDRIMDILLDMSKERSSSK